jgi:hypothetical protein
MPRNALAAFLSASPVGQKTTAPRRRKHARKKLWGEYEAGVAQAIIGKN